MRLVKLTHGRKSTHSIILVPKSKIHLSSGPFNMMFLQSTSHMLHVRRHDVFFLVFSVDNVSVVAQLIVNGEFLELRFPKKTSFTSYCCRRLPVKLRNFSGKTSCNPHGARRA